MYTTDNLHEKIKALRLYRGYKTQNAAATLLKTSRNQFCGWENGKTPPGIQSLVKLANAFKVEINYFCADGPPEDFDLTVVQDTKEGDTPFVETLTAKTYFYFLKKTKEKKERVLLNVYPFSGTTRTITEYSRLNPGCVIIDALRLPEKLDRKTAKLYIIDNAESPSREILKDFLYRCIPPYAPVAVFTSEQIDFRYFDREYFIQGIAAGDLEMIITETFPLINELKEKDSTLYKKILMVFSSEAFNKMEKLEEFMVLFSKKNISGLSMYTILSFFSRWV